MCGKGCRRPPICPAQQPDWHQGSAALCQGADEAVAQWRVLLRCKCTAPPRSTFQLAATFQSQIRPLWKETNLMSPGSNLSRWLPLLPQPVIHTHWLWFNVTVPINMEKSWKGSIRSSFSNLCPSCILQALSCSATPRTQSSELPFFPSLFTATMVLISAQVVRTVSDISDRQRSFNEKQTTPTQTGVEPDDSKTCAKPF